MGWSEFREGQGKQGQWGKPGQNKKVRISGGAVEAQKGGDEESHVEGCYEVGENSQQIKFERKRRSFSEGDYPTKPPKDVLKTGKVFMKARPKHTLAHIVRLKWDENTLDTKGAKREAFYNSCIKSLNNCVFFIFPVKYLAGFTFILILYGIWFAGIL